SHTATRRWGTGPTVAFRSWSKALPASLRNGLDLHLQLVAHGTHARHRARRVDRGKTSLISGHIAGQTHDAVAHLDGDGGVILVAARRQGLLDVLTDAFILGLDLLLP